MAFHEVRLPTNISLNAVGGSGFKTTVLILASGAEQRNIDWSVPRGEWDIGYGIRTKANMDTLVNFFVARNGKAHGFRFKDHTDFQIGDKDNPTTDNQSIGTGDGVKTVFQIFRRYTSGGIDFDVDKTKIVSGTQNVLLDNVLKTDPGDYSIDLNTGKITFVTAPAGSVDVEFAGEFDVPVRFDTDRMEINALMFSVNSKLSSWPNVPIIEIRI